MRPAWEEKGRHASPAAFDDSDSVCVGGCAAESAAFHGCRSRFLPPCGTRRSSPPSPRSAASLPPRPRRVLVRSVSIERVRISQLAGEGRLTARSGPASVPQRNRVVGLLPLQVLNRTLHCCLPRHESDASAPAIVDRTMFVSALPSASGHAPTAERSGLAAQSPARAHRARSSHGPVLKDPQRDADDEHDPAHHEPNREQVRRQDRNPPHDTLRTTSA